MTHEILREAWNAMKHNRHRTGVDHAGYAWGIATVVCCSHMARIRPACENIFATFGTKTMILVPGPHLMQAGGEKAGAPLRFPMEMSTC